MLGLLERELTSVSEIKQIDEGEAVVIMHNRSPDKPSASQITSFSRKCTSIASDDSSKISDASKTSLRRKAHTYDKFSTHQISYQTGQSIQIPLSSSQCSNRSHPAKLKDVKRESVVGELYSRLPYITGEDIDDKKDNDMEKLSQRILSPITISSTDSLDLSHLYCHICHMPWKKYLQKGKVKPKYLHTEVCIEKNLADLEECPNGYDCDVSLENHYWTFSHKNVATTQTVVSAALTNIGAYQTESNDSTPDLKWNDIRNENDILNSDTPDLSIEDICKNTEQDTKYTKLKNPGLVTPHADDASDSAETEVFNRSPESETLLKEEDSVYTGVQRTNTDRSSSIEIVIPCCNDNSREKVDSWLDSSINYFTPVEAKIEPMSEDCLILKKDKVSLSVSLKEDGNCIRHYSESDGDQKVCGEVDITNRLTEPTTEKNCAVSSGDMPECVHFHFHISNSPKKFVQVTLDKYFKSHSAESGINDSLPKPDNGETSGFCNDKTGVMENKKEVLQAWKNMLSGKVKKSVVPTSSSAIVTESTPKQTSYRRSTCPLHKRIEDTSFAVDAFNYGSIEGVTSYFLTHFHYDHYQGLSSQFQRNIYCSKITANLVRLKMKINNRYLHVLPLEEPRIIEGVEVTLFDANHCPGAVMFLFCLTTGKSILHVGDFRAHPDMESISALWNCSPLDVLYLDTTYLNPDYDFPSQEAVLEKCREIAVEHAKTCRTPVFLIGSYTIGKEKVFKVIATELNCKIYAPDSKVRVLRCLEDPEINARLTTNKHEAKVHVLSMRELHPMKVKKYLSSLGSSVVGIVIKPTGWEHNASLSDDFDSLRPSQVGSIYSYGIPYSEHSSYNELKRFVKFARPRKIIPTVYESNGERRKKMENTLNQWKRDMGKALGKRYLTHLGRIM